MMKLRRPRLVLASGLGLAGVLVGFTSVVALQPAHAAPPPPSGCANAAQANSSWAGWRGGGQNASYQIWNEVIGTVCLARRSPTAGTVSFTWGINGDRMLSGTFWWGVYDCTARRLSGRWTSYPHGTSANYGHFTRNITLIRNHKYRPHVFGQGEYQRWAASTGYWSIHSPTGIKPFVGDGRRCV
jgi:hypothetical protein